MGIMELIGTLFQGVVLLILMAIVIGFIFAYPLFIAFTLILVGVGVCIYLTTEE